MCNVAIMLILKKFCWSIFWAIKCCVRYLVDILLNLVWSISNTTPLAALPILPPRGGTYAAVGYCCALHIVSYACISHFLALTYLLTFRHILKWIMSHNVFVCMFAFGPNLAQKALFFALVVHFWGRSWKSNIGLLAYLKSLSYLNRVIIIVLLYEVPKCMSSISPDIITAVWYKKPLTVKSKAAAI